MDGIAYITFTADHRVTVVSTNIGPSIATNTGATVDEGSLNNVITTAMLNEGDPDDDGSELTYMITTNVTAGTLRLNGIVIGASSTFTQADIDGGGLLTYTHDGSEFVSDSFDFSLADGGENGAMPVSGNFNFTINPVNDGPTFNSLNGTPTYIEGGSAVVLDADVTIADAELTLADNFGGATLTLARNGGANAEDQLTFDGVTVTVSGPNVSVGGIQVGTYSFTGGQLSITFNGNATNARVNTLVQNIQYFNTSDTPPASVQIDWSFDDGNSGAQGIGGGLNASGSTTVNITATNDDPTNTGSLPTDIAVTEDVLSNIDLSAIDLSDLDHGGGNLTLSLSTDTGGNLTAARTEAMD